MIEEKDAQAAVDYLRDNAHAAAKSRSERFYLEAYTKSLKAIIMKEHDDLPLGAQEREALADERYLKHLEATSLAVFEDEKFRFLREAAKGKYETWRSMNANERAIKF